MAHPVKTFKVCPKVKVTQWDVSEGREVDVIPLKWEPSVLLLTGALAQNFAVLVNSQTGTSGSAACPLERKGFSWMQGGDS